MNTTQRRLVTIELDPSWADEHMNCYSCSYPILDWEDVVAVPTSVVVDDFPTGAAFVHRVCPVSFQDRDREERDPATERNKEHWNVVYPTD